MQEREEQLLPNGTLVVFYPETHQYFVDDKELPSVTTLLSKVYGNAYAGVNPEILKRAAEYGTAVHDELQQLIEMRKQSPDVPLDCAHQETRNYFTFVESIYKVEPLLTEQMVVLYDGGKPVAAGRFDLLCNVKGKLTLADFKTTTTIHKQLVTAQLNLYLKAARQSGYIDPDADVDLQVIQLSGEKARMVPVTKLSDNFYLKFVNIDENI